MRPRPALLLMAASLLAALAIAPAASAAAKVELTAKVLAVNPGKPPTGCPYPSRIEVTDHGRAAGMIKVKHCAATATGAFYSGSADLDVGSLTGPANFGVAFHPVPPNFTEPKFGTGSLSKGEEGEQLRVKGGTLPDEVGAQFQLVLYPSI
jgi:hypothetical protein